MDTPLLPCRHTMLRRAVHVIGIMAALVALCCATPAAQRDRLPTLFVQVTDAGFSPDNKYVVTGYSGGKKLLTLWGTATGKEVRSFAGHNDRISGVAFVCGGKRVLSSSRNGMLLLHDIATGKQLASVQAYAGQVSHLTVSADGKEVVTVGYDKDKEVAKLWAADDLKLLRAFGGPDLEAFGMALSPDHKWALTGFAGPVIVNPPSVVLWDLRTGRAKYTLPGKQGWECPAAAFSPDSRLALVSKSKYSRVGYSANGRRTTQLALWDVQTGKVCRLLDGGEALAQFTLDGKQVVGVASYGTEKVRVSFWDVASGKRGRSVEFSKGKKEYPGLYFSPDGRLALAVTGGVEEGPRRPSPYGPAVLRLAVWDLDADRVVREWTRPPAD